MTLGLIALAACSSTPTIAIAAEPYAGPAIRVDSAGERHVVVLAAPTSGWRFTLDQVRPAMDRRDVFVTIVRPNPVTMQTQAVVEQRVGPGVARSMPIRVFARLVDWGQAPQGAAYRHAAVSATR